jgi:PAS domain S-box-containing protein
LVNLPSHLTFSGYKTTERVESATAPSVVQNPDYLFPEINPSFGKQTGLTCAQSKRICELAPKHENYWIEIYGKISLTGEPSRFVALYDRDGKYLLLNHYADGYSGKNVIGKSLYEFISDGSKRMFREAFNNANNTGKTQYVEITGLGDNGSLRFYYSHIIPLYDNNEFTYFLVLANDITERKQADEELRFQSEILGDIA